MGLDWESRRLNPSHATLDLRAKFLKEAIEKLHHKMPPPPPLQIRPRLSLVTADKWAHFSTNDKRYIFAGGISLDQKKNSQPATDSKTK